MKKTVVIGLVLALGIILGASVSPLLAQSQALGSQQYACSIGERSSAACSGQWIIFAGNADNLDSGAWVVRVDRISGEIWYKDGKRLRLLDSEK